MARPQTKKRALYLLSFLAFFLVLFISAPTLVGAKETVDNTDRFYGNQSLNSLVAGDKMMMSLPGGARVEIGDSQATYVVNDHISSARVAIATDQYNFRSVCLYPIW